MKVRYVPIVAALAVVAVAASATPGIRSGLVKSLSVKDSSKVAQAQCNLCHAGAPPKLNPFGQDLQKAMRAKKTKAFNADVWKQIENLDSDKDGAKNGAEIKADTLPGDPSSKPASKAKPPKPKK